MKHSSSLSQQFEEINELLEKTRQYWQILPFQHLEHPWKNDPALSQFLASLDTEYIEYLDEHDELLREKISEFLPFSLDVIAPLHRTDGRLDDVPVWFKAGIKGRKWLQIEKFSSQVPNNGSSVLEWCAGKGHLGRALGLTQQRSITSLEWQQSLCEQGKLLADKYQVDQRFVQGDVYAPSTKLLLQPKQHVIALHACGDLHVELFKQASLASSQSLTVAPCCYHLINDETYQPLSLAAQRSELQLNKRDLALSMAQTVVATQRERKHRATEIAWRLGFDLLQREIRNDDSYLPLPSIRQSMLTGHFSDFCRWACEAKSLPFPGDVDIEKYQQLGWQRRKTNAQIELVTHAFRQLIERWLLLDRALFLVEQGYDVTLSEFCDKRVTPRNALIKAERRVST